MIYQDPLAYLLGLEGIAPPCGTGRFAEFLAQRGHQVIGVDSSPDMLAHARRRVPEGELRVGELGRLPLPAPGHLALSARAPARGRFCLTAMACQLGSADRQPSGQIRDLRRLLSIGTQAWPGRAAKKGVPGDELRSD